MVDRAIALFIRLFYKKFKMAKGSWSATDTSAIIIPANPYRAKLVIQMRSGDLTALGFGEDAVYNSGITLMTPGHIVIMAGALAREPVYAVCAGGNSSNGGYQEDLSLTV